MSREDTARARRMWGGLRSHPPTPPACKVRAAALLRAAWALPELATSPLARVAQGRVLLDIEPLHGARVEIVVGTESAGMNAVDGTQVVDLVNIAGDAERAHHLAARV